MPFHDGAGTIELQFFVFTYRIFIPDFLFLLSAVIALSHCVTLWFAQHFLSSNTSATVGRVTLGSTPPPSLSSRDLSNPSEREREIPQSCLLHLLNVIDVTSALMTPKEYVTLLRTCDLSTDISVSRLPAIYHLCIPTLTCLSSASTARLKPNATLIPFV